MKQLIIVIMCINLIACSSSSTQPEGGAVVGVALGDSTTATTGDPAVGALIGPTNN